MTIDEAIRFIDNFIKDWGKGYPTNLETAMKLGIEALKFYKDWRISPGAPALHRLPGENPQ